MKNKLKNKYISIFLPLLAPVLIILSLAPTPAYAVPAGCYLGEGNGANTYTLTACPNEGVARAVGQYQACYVVLSGGAFEERNCEKLEESANKVPEISSTPSITNDGGTSEDGISRDELSDGKCDPKNDDNPNNDNDPLSKENCGIIRIIVDVINFLSAVAGIALVASLMISGYLYMTARDNAGQVEKAKSRIVQTLIALTLFIFMYALLNFLVPGGLGLG